MHKIAVFFSLCTNSHSHQFTIKMFSCFCHSFKIILSTLILTSIDWLTNLPIKINCITDYLCMTLLLTSRSPDPSVCLAGWSIDSQTANTSLLCIIDKCLSKYTLVVIEDILLNFHSVMIAQHGIKKHQQQNHVTANL